MTAEIWPVLCRVINKPICGSSGKEDSDILAIVWTGQFIRQVLYDQVAHTSQFRGGVGFACLSVGADRFGRVELRGRDRRPDLGGKWSGLTHFAR